MKKERLCVALFSFLDYDIFRLNHFNFGKLHQKCRRAQKPCAVAELRNQNLDLRTELAREQIAIQKRLQRFD